MTGEADYDENFLGTTRQKFIFCRLLSLLSGKCQDIDDIFAWMEGPVWEDSAVSDDQACVFASLAKAQPDVFFRFTVYCIYYTTEGWNHKIEYKEGLLNLESIHGEDYFDEDLQETIWDGDIISSIECKIDKEGNIEEEWRSVCLELEKERLSELLGFIDKGTDDPSHLINLGIIFETGLAGVDKNPAEAWDCYLKAAGTGDKDAIEFVKMIFSDESKKDLQELLEQKHISRDSFPVFFDLAGKENNPELTAKLSEYKRTIDEQLDGASGSKSEPAAEKESCSGLTFVITGNVHSFKNRDAFKAYVEANGGKVAGSVSKKTDYLVNNDVTSTSSKNVKARELNIPIISEDDFIARFGQ